MRTGSLLATCCAVLSTTLCPGLLPGLPASAHANVPASGAAPSPAAHAPPAAPALTGSAIFFAVEGDGDQTPLALVPLLCYDARVQKLAAGTSCLPLVPPGATVMTDRGPAKVGARAPLKCAAATGTTGLAPGEGLRLLPPGPPAAGKPVEPYAYAVWPSVAAARLQLLPEANTLATMSTVEVVLRRAIQQRGQSVADLGVYQVALLDLDGDGKRERVYSATVPDSRGKTLWSGLFAGDAKGAAARVISEDLGVPARDHSMRVMGAMDLDHDGKLELWVSTAGTNLEHTSVRRFDGAALQTVATYANCLAGQ